VTTGSLRVRLLAGAALWIGLALLVAGSVIASLFVGIVEREQQADLSATFNRVVALIDERASPPTLSAPLTDPRYDTPFGGTYWQIEEPGVGTSRSRSLWDFSIPTAAISTASAPLFTTLPGPAGQSLSALVRDLRLANDRPLRVTIAEDRAPLDLVIGRFGSALAVALGVLAVALFGAAWLQVRIGLSPLRQLRRGVERVRRGEADRLSADVPREVVPLTVEVNELLAAQQATIQFARARAADLAHGLKTPLSVLATTAAALRHKADAETADHLDFITREMTDRVNYQLRLAGLRTRTRTHLLAADLGQAIERTVAVLKRTPEGEQRKWTLLVEENLIVDIDDHDLIELVGVLLENAAKWARENVRVTASRADGLAKVEIVDDGPGMTAEQIAQLGRRGGRLDESQAGSGLGIAIAHDIVALNGGTLSIDRGPRGGLQVSLQLPLSTADN
jgi:signal transduction histidine kinase